MRVIRVLLSCSLLIAVSGAIRLDAQSETTHEDRDVRLPNGRLQRDVILKADHEKNLEDAAEMSRLADEVKLDLEKNTQYVFSIEDVKKLQEIEKLAKRIRSRMKRL